jgi:hypothetical protein
VSSVVSDKKPTLPTLLKFSFIFADISFASLNLFSSNVVIASKSFERSFEFISSSEKSVGSSLAILLCLSKFRKIKTTAAELNIITAIKERNIFVLMFIIKF